MVMRMVLAACLLAAAGAAAAAEWIRDAESGCALWNPHPVPNETITWDGACEDGKASGDGVVEWFERGEMSERVEGHFVAGKLNGYGVWTREGHRYEGEFVDDQFHGEGTYTWPSGARYEGQFENDEPHGHGVHTTPAGHRYEGPYVEGKRHGAGRCYEPGDGWHRCRYWRGEEIRDLQEARPAGPLRSSAA